MAQFPWLYFSIMAGGLVLSICVFPAGLVLSLQPQTPHQFGRVLPT